MGSSALELLERLREAQNRHDLDAMVACFAEDYRSEQPAYPDRQFGGAAQVRKNWSALLSAMPDFHAELVRGAQTDDEAWVEWHWRATRPDGSPYEARGVVIMGVVDDRITWGRLYMSEVEHEGAGIDEGHVAGAGMELQRGGDAEDATADDEDAHARSLT